MDWFDWFYIFVLISLLSLFGYLLLYSLVCKFWEEAALVVNRIIVSYFEERKRFFQELSKDPAIKDWKQ